jgi:hypothetical protein
MMFQGSDEGPWNHSFRFEHKLGPRLKITALIDPAVERAHAVLRKKCESYVTIANNQLAYLAHPSVSSCPLIKTREVSQFPLINVVTIAHHFVFQYSKALTNMWPQCPVLLTRIDRVCLLLAPRPCSVVLLSKVGCANSVQTTC